MSLLVWRHAVCFAAGAAQYVRITRALWRLSGSSVANRSLGALLGFAVGRHGRRPPSHSGPVRPEGRSARREFDQGARMRIIMAFCLINWNRIAFFDRGPNYTLFCLGYYLL